MKFYIKDNYYFDLDLQNQLRISGPENHLFLGLTFPQDVKVEFKEYLLKQGNLCIKIKFDVKQLLLTIPVVTDIRTLRNYTEQLQPRPTYSELVEQRVEEVSPKSVKVARRGGEQVVEFMNVFNDEDGSEKRYGSVFRFSKSTTVELLGQKLNISSKKPLEMTVCTATNIRIRDRLRKKIYNSTYALPSDLFTPELLTLYEQSKEFVEHLIRFKKTSSFEYGTIFPRDWIESADLGYGDLSQQTVDYMYGQSMQHVSENGEGWHENVIGEFKTKLKDHELHIDRKMIDIEPRYIMGMRNMSKTFLTDHTVQDRLRLIAKFILRNADEQELISFKKIGDSEEYNRVGNWRDSFNAYPDQRSPLSPYDVNCVFYPASLRIIREFNQFFQIEDMNKLNQLIEKWSKQKDKFRLYHSPTLIGYCLALHGKKHLPFPVAHLDESYELFYGVPSMEEIVSFAEKIMDPNFFYTPVGPMLVDVDAEAFTTEQYHGKVIWPKQTAYAVAGLAKQFRRGLKEGWPWPMIEKIKASVITTSEASFTGWQQLSCVPELYYYDEKEQRARLYIDQPKYEAQMSLIQLWSSVGCRRIMQEYASVRKIAEAV